ncbi:SARP family transcriptional regulator [Virgisporangium aliadipatigenens]|uniref:SARP family transcriptional regulator n=1 Tax=Virgisporangium aliadipatigenens TaxID=741659 RepID=A0A8J3YUI7_9ACTN|nr:BTAD domain-containing putative transcriptional regulator [Virgisporangium aliadipatigenens]GIJ51766.1 SARP family transcriptional regulator [Virgisporangium aliadipatigenens]
MIEFYVLGQLQVWADGSRLRLRGTRQERLLAGLLLDSGRTVPIERLAAAVWEDEPPPTAERQVRNLAADLRRRLVAAGAPAQTMATERAGYRIAVDGDRLDAERFHKLVATARAGRDSDPAGAVAAFRAALALWRGELLDGLGGRLVESVAPAWTERRLAAWEECLSLELALGRHADVVAELSELAVRYPFRERLTELAMLALYRCGRQSEALTAYRELRCRLADELGVDPTGDVTRLHEAILRRDVAPREAEQAAQAPRPAQLPARPPTFVGRDAELAVLDALAARTAAEGAEGAGAVGAITGTAGVGKTALAVHWSHRAAERFPDGQLYVDLHGFEPSGTHVSAGEAVRGFLDALGVSGPRVPDGEAAQAALYRTLLSGRRMLVVLDNARDAAHVRPLLPGSGTCMVLVTSRDELTGLVAVADARPLPMKLFSSSEATDLLTRRIGKERVTAEPDAVDAIVRRCAGLPLALAITAARAATRPGFDLSSLAGELRDANGFPAGPLSGTDPATDIASVFDWSYRTLRPEAARLFRLIGVHPGTDVTAAAAASLAGVGVEESERLLRDLARGHLVAEPVPGRFAAHDLLRAYAAHLAHAHEPPAERTNAVRRVLDHYLRTAHAATLLLNPRRDAVPLVEPLPGVIPQVLCTTDAALRWFTEEHDTLLAAVTAAADLGLDAHAWQLAWAYAPILDRRGYWRDWIAVQEVALDAARRLGDLRGQADGHRHLAGALGRLGRYDEASAHYTRALELYQELADGTGEANMLINLSWVFEQQGRHRDALAATLRSLDIFRAAGNRTGEAVALNATGWHLAHLEEFADAADYCGRALALHEALENPVGAGNTFDSLGFIRHRLGDLDGAAEAYARSLEIFRRVGDRYSEACAMAHIGDVLYAAGTPVAARNAWRDALAVFERFSPRDAERIRVKLLQ